MQRPLNPSLCLQYFNPAVYYNHYCCFYSTATVKLLRASLFPGAAELTTPLLRLTSILCLPLCRINKLGNTSLEDCCNPLYLWVINPQSPSKHRGHCWLVGPRCQPPWTI